MPGIILELKKNMKKCTSYTRRCCKLCHMARVSKILRGLPFFSSTFDEVEMSLCNYELSIVGCSADYSLKDGNLKFYVQANLCPHTCTSHFI